MPAETFNSLGGFSTGIPEVVVVNSAGNVVTNVLTSGNVQASTMYSGAYRHSNGSSITTGAGSLVVAKASGQGIFVDVNTPTYGWHDLMGSTTVEETGAPNRPTFTTYRGGINQYRFATANQMWTEFRVPHDYVPNTVLYIHAHWSHIGTDVTSGSVTWSFEMTYAKGFDQEVFAAPITATAAQAASTVQYRHMIAETAASGGGLLPTASIEPDGLILVRTSLTVNTISPSYEPFLHFVGLHYQSTGVPTKQRAPDFYV